MAANPAGLYESCCMTPLPHKLAATLRPPATGVHPTAIIEPGAQLGVGVEIGPWCHVGGAVTIGDGARLISHVVVDGETEIGEAALLYPVLHRWLGAAGPEV